MEIEINFIKNAGRIDYKFINNIFISSIKNIFKVILSEEKKVCSIANIVLLRDNDITEFNNFHLQKEKATDVISVGYADANKHNILDLLVSVETVKKNAKYYGTDFVNEMFRVLIHGFLHFCGYNDYNDSDLKIMKKLETKYLKLIR
jgi:rRNA maturation RNase YbeY